MYLGSMPQISLAYSEIVLSELNLPALWKMYEMCFSLIIFNLAMFMIAILAHLARSVYVLETRSWAVT